MVERAAGRWIAGVGLVLAVVGAGLTTDMDPPFIRAGLVVGVVGLLCFLVVGWVDFGRKSQW